MSFGLSNYDSKYGLKVAYLSMEFAIDQALKTYSGGLGYLAGSHMRSAYQLRQNMIGVGMLWKYGYYDQVRDESGNMRVLMQEKRYSFLEDTGIKVEVSVNGHSVKVKAYYLAPEIFGTVPMYFLTTDIDENDDLARSITRRLYDSNGSARVAQSIVLGIGGAKVVEALGGCDCFHINEAHALPIAFHLFDKYKTVQGVKRNLVFTTHTPVKAGNAVRNIHFLNEMGFFNGIPLDKVRALTGMYGNDFEYTPAALRMSKIANGVSQLHGQVANKMWENYPNTCTIKAITNAQDEEYWTDKLLKEALDRDDNTALVNRKKQLKRALFRVVADQTGDLFDENVLTIVWARRYAGYKRADLIMRDTERFYQMIERLNRPVQVIWSGKPFPEDHNAINQFNHILYQSHHHKNMAVLTGYELALSALLKKGADIWLNTPRRPKEASGTSGMTAAMNGAVNLSVQDGWMPEYGKHGVNSFLIPIVHETDHFLVDNHDNQYLLHILEENIIPLYYEQPDQWLEIVKNSMRDVCPQFDSKRMAREYYEEIYQFDME